MPASFLTTHLPHDVALPAASVDNGCCPPRPLSRFIEGPFTWPAQQAGFLIAKHDPWQIQGDPNDEKFRMAVLSMREGITQSRLQSRRQLLDQLDRGRPAAVSSEAVSFRQLGMDDLESSGLLSETLVIVVGEFGRGQSG